MTPPWAPLTLTSSALLPPFIENVLKRVLCMLNPSDTHNVMVSTSVVGFESAGQDLTDSKVYADKMAIN